MMFSPNDKYFVMCRTRKNVDKAEHLNLVFGFQEPARQRPVFFQDVMVGLGRLLVRIGSYLEKHYSRLADEYKRENLKRLPAG